MLDRSLALKLAHTALYSDVALTPREGGQTGRVADKIQQAYNTALNDVQRIIMEEAESRRLSNDIAGAMTLESLHRLLRKEL